MCPENALTHQRKKRILFLSFLNYLATNHVFIEKLFQNVALSSKLDNLILEITYIFTFFFAKNYAMANNKFDNACLVQMQHNELNLEHNIAEFCPDHFKQEFRSEPVVCIKTNLMQMVNDFYQIQKEQGVTVQIGNQNFNCRLLIMQCYSAYFANRSKSEKHIELPDKVTPQAFHKIYSWMMSTQKTVGRNGLIEMLKAAEFLLIEHLVQRCWRLIEDCRWFREGFFN